MDEENSLESGVLHTLTVSEAEGAEEPPTADGHPFHHRPLNCYLELKQVYMLPVAAVQS